MMRFSLLIFLNVGMLLAPLGVFADRAQVNSVRLWTAPERTRVVFDVNAPQAHEIFLLQQPARVVIDLHNTRLSSALPALNSGHALIKKIRTGVKNGQDLRVVLDLKTAVKPRSFVLKPNEKYGHRLVVDLHDGIRSKRQHPSPAWKPVNKRDVVVAIDAGHGGEDPGAHGVRGTLEKDVVLSIARRLARLIDQAPGMKSFLVRDGDYYIGLRRRVKKARRARADLLISIHADAFKDASVRGSSVFTLSRKGASGETARWLAARENAADLVGGVSLDDKDDLLAKVLLDLSLTAKQSASTDVARKVLRNLRRLGPVHQKSVQKAGFVVLRSPDIPSILVETAFISNPSEERKLQHVDYQQRLARSIFRGVKDYFSINPPPDSLLVSNKHVISSGETLSEIAQVYGTTLRQLRSLNSLKSSRIRAGQVLQIPAGS